MTRALVLSGGACKGSYQVGVLRKWMLEERREYDIFCGVSVGALNVSLLAHYRDSREAQFALENVWRHHVSNDAIYRRWFPFGRVSGLWKHSLFDSSPLRELVMSHIDVQKIRESGKRLSVGAVCLETGEKVFGTEEDDNLAEWVLASASYPVFFTPVNIGGRFWFDGAVKNMTPLGRAIELGATEIDMIVCSNPDVQRPVPQQQKSFPLYRQISRVVDVMSDQVLRTDMQITSLKNQLSRARGDLRPVTVRYVQPAERLTENSFDFDPKTISKMIEKGYRDASGGTLIL